MMCSSGHTAAPFGPSWGGKTAKGRTPSPARVPASGRVPGNAQQGLEGGCQSPETLIARVPAAERGRVRQRAADAGERVLGAGVIGVVRRALARIAEVEPRGGDWAGGRRQEDLAGQPAPCTPPSLQGCRGRGGLLAPLAPREHQGFVPGQSTEQRALSHSPQQHFRTPATVAAQHLSLAIFLFYRISIILPMVVADRPAEDDRPQRPAPSYELAPSNRVLHSTFLHREPPCHPCIPTYLPTYLPAWGKYHCSRTPPPPPPFAPSHQLALVATVE
jgi:hypothetical protein